jgi:UDPglucose--hexose-1-phosphate uridylyltransferase
MHELRKDPVLSRWVAVLKDSQPPEAYSDNCVSAEPGECAFCLEASGRSLWHIEPPQTVFKPGDTLARHGMGMYDTMHAVGAHEMLIDSPTHDKAPEDLGAAHYGDVVQYWLARATEMTQDERIRFVTIGRSVGRQAGAAFGHPHSTLVAQPVIPYRIKAELDGAKEYFAYKERCVFCDILDEELRLGTRVVYESEHFVAFCPFSPRFPFEVWVFSRRHECKFMGITKDECGDLGEVLTKVIKRLRVVLGDPPYSYIVHSAPGRLPKRSSWHTLGDDYHWHIEIMPRLSVPSGAELGSGLYVVSTSPEDAARYLREE